MVRIREAIYYKILFDTPILPPETGGILGSENCIITSYMPDKGVYNGKIGQYVPTISILNKQIQEWYDQNIMFCGIYHTHYEGDIRLSGGDILYIESILRQFQPYVDSLLFPLVFPKKEIIFYSAKLQEGHINVIDEEILIIN